jgi:hypothetical protein
MSDTRRRFDEVGGSFTHTNKNTHKHARTHTHTHTHIHTHMYSKRLFCPDVER